MFPITVLWNFLNRFYYRLSNPKSNSNRTRATFSRLGSISMEMSCSELIFFFLVWIHMLQRCCLCIIWMHTRKKKYQFRARNVHSISDKEQKFLLRLIWWNLWISYPQNSPFKSAQRKIKQLIIREDDLQNHKSWWFVIFCRLSSLIISCFIFILSIFKSNTSGKNNML